TKRRSTSSESTQNWSRSMARSANRSRARWQMARANAQDRHMHLRRPASPDRAAVRAKNRWEQFMSRSRPTDKQKSGNYFFQATVRRSNNSPRRWRLKCCGESELKITDTDRPADFSMVVG